MQRGWHFVRIQWNILRKPSHLSISFFLVYSYFLHFSSVNVMFMNYLILCADKIGCMPFTWVNSAKNLDIQMKLRYHITIKLLLWTHQLLILSIGCMPHAWNYYLSMESRILRFWRFFPPFSDQWTLFWFIIVFDIVHLFWLHLTVICISSFSVLYSSS